MSKRILIIDGHPDPSPEHYVHALTQAYRAGAESAGHEVKCIELARAPIEFLRSTRDYSQGTPAAEIREFQQTIEWCNHMVILYPLWLGTMPALLKAFFEQVMRPGFAFPQDAAQGMFKKRLKGKSARVIVTMGMPAFFYRVFYRAHSLKSLERNILSFVGFNPVRASIIGHVETKHAEVRSKWLDRMRAYGGAAR